MGFPGVITSPNKNNYKGPHLVHTLEVEKMDTEHDGHSTVKFCVQK